MKKKLILKKWIQKILGAVLIISFVLLALGFECDNMKAFTLYYLVNGGLMIGSFYLLYNYSHIFE